MARVVQRIDVDAEDLSPTQLARSLEQGVRDVALARMREEQRANPNQRFELRVLRRGRQVVAEVVAVATASAGRTSRAGTGGAGKAPKRAPLVEWVKKRGIRPRDGRAHRDPVTSMAVAIQRAFAKRGRLQRAAAAQRRAKRRAASVPKRAVGASQNLGRYARLMANRLKGSA